MATHGVRSQRVPQPVRIVLDVGEGHALGADVPAAEEVRVVPSNREHLRAVVLHLDSARGLTQHADRVVRSALRHGFPPGRAAPLSPGSAPATSTNPARAKGTLSRQP